MSVRIRKYNHKDDFIPVGEFLAETFQPDNGNGNFHQPTWEYALSHPLLDETTLDKIGVWDDSGAIVGVAHCEWYAGEAFFEIHRDYLYLKPAMLDYAEKHLYGTASDGRTYLKAFVNDFDTDFEYLVRERGYQKDDTQTRPLSQMKIPGHFQPDVSVPDGFRLTSLAEENNVEKLTRVLWRGFHPEQAFPAIDVAGRAKQQSAPHFRKDLNIVVVAPDGEYAAYAGTWFETTNKYALLEPVCTDPDYRRMGLGRAAVMEGIRRCAEMGAQVAYVGSEQPFYLAMGFEKIYSCNCWTKYLN